MLHSSTVKSIELYFGLIELGIGLIALGLKTPGPGHATLHLAVSVRPSVRNISKFVGGFAFQIIGLPCIQPCFFLFFFVYFLFFLVTYTLTFVGLLVRPSVHLSMMSEL